MKEIISAGGPGLLIPSVLFVLMLYVTRGLFGLHGRRNQNRKEFLDLWNASRTDDDLWLEVIVRHLFGTYLPARIIRLALAQPDRAQSLIDLCELWPLLRFDSSSQKVNWLHKRHQTYPQLQFGRAILIIGYFASALIAVLSVLVAFHFGPTSITSWIYGFCSPIFACLAVICLMREDTIGAAAKVGHIWVSRINRESSTSTTALKRQR